MSSQTQTGVLPVGLLIDGELHRNFELRAPTVGDNVDAAIDSGTDNPLELSTAVFARQLLRLGTLPKEKLTTALLLQLNPMDWNALEAADGELRKKLMRSGQGLAGGQTAAPPSPDTVSAP